MGRAREDEEGAWCVERGGHQRTLGRGAEGGHNKVNGGGTNGARRDDRAV